MSKHRLEVVGFHFLAVSLFAAGCPSWQAQNDRSISRVPFVGCRSDGQIGPLKSPKSSANEIKLPNELANQLAYYKAENGVGILAPRNWYCFSAYGSNGSSLFVSPEPIKDRELFRPGWKGFSGPAIEVSVSYGGTSGRFAVAEAIARVFPDRMEFVRDIASEGFAPASSFPIGQYATDTLQRRGKNIVEFETPPHTEGLGSHSRLEINASPIDGVAILVGDEPDLIKLSMRLPPPYQRLSRVVIEELEIEASKLSSDKQ